MAYSQGNEEEIILANLGNKGRLLDIGAHDGMTFSNSYALISKHKWTGVLVEPSPSIFPKLLQNMQQFKEVVCLNAAITPTDQGIIEFYDSRGDFLSTNVEAMFHKWPKAIFDKYYTKSVSVDELIDFGGHDYKFINIDVEGANWDILTAIPFNLMTSLEVVCVEFDDKFNEMKAFMKSKGFELIFSNGENMIFKSSMFDGSIKL